MPALSAPHSYSREDVRRMLAVSERTLRSWEKHELIAAGDSFGFSDLIALRTIVKLRQNKIAPARIRRALASLRAKLRDVDDPLREVKIFLEDGKIRVQVHGQKMEPITGQLLFDFDQAEMKRLLSFPREEQQHARKEDKSVRPRQLPHQQRASAERWFQRGLELEQTGAPVEEVIEAYNKAAQLDTTSAGALVNLGTVYFNRRSWREAEIHYRKAIEVEPDYPLAHFNLANLYDEIGDRTRAVEHYETALRLNPQYADAHYNLALLHQNSGALLKAVQHWKTYVKLDPNSSWAAIARRELEKLRRATLVKGTGPGSSEEAGA